ncbi:MAG: substrate-binding domain-containing protein [Hydrogenophaga sp.]|uniref:substrate-binding domain-containing protein n=1 Tax=Hydrogenophaga sp. TaxID=1904254 RepID=UPI001DAC738E|nr:substrate-binding domain-containing protein [Hydrogenophaga sp.]MBX3611344.1 substrate-binding domain-containing protein [Hydrogenophaga sp.]
MSTPLASGPVRVMAAGSLREAFEALAPLHRAAGGPAWCSRFAAAGLLRQRIEAGVPADVFASANLDHPRALAQQGGWSEPQVFAHNPMCALVAPSLRSDPHALLDALLNPALRLGTSTPLADPSGDYALAVFDRAEALKAGARDALRARAMALTGGPQSPRAPEGRNTYAWVMAEHRLDVFLTYRTNAQRAQREWAELRVVALPEALSVRADYGLCWRLAAGQGAEQLAQWLLGAQARDTLASHGFELP